MRRHAAALPAEFQPPEIRPFLKGADIYDSSCSPEASVYFLDQGDGLYLKISQAGTLFREAEMTAYFSRLGLSAQVLHYGTHEGSDYLITARIPGEDCTDRHCLDDPKKLCDTTASLLRALHETDGSLCPVQDRLESYSESVRRGLAGRHCESDLFAGLWEFGSLQETRVVAEEGLRNLRKDALIHGDYCLPNIILNGWDLSGYIDLGNGGIADSHIDILWGIWTLNYNLGTVEYSDRFMDAYGRDRIDPDRLRMIAAMEMIGI